jgi:hypothetical protein
LNVAGALSGRGAVGESLLGVAENLQRNALLRQAQQQRALESQFERQQAFQKESRVFQTVKKQALATAKLAEGIEDPRMRDVAKGLALSGQTDEANRVLLGIESSKLIEGRRMDKMPRDEEIVLRGMQSGQITQQSTPAQIRAFLSGATKRRISDKEFSSLITSFKERGILADPGLIFGVKADPQALQNALSLLPGLGLSPLQQKRLEELRKKSGQK